LQISLGSPLLLQLSPHGTATTECQSDSRAVRLANDRSNNLSARLALTLVPREELGIPDYRLDECQVHSQQQAKPSRNRQGRILGPPFVALTEWLIALAIRLATKVFRRELLLCWSSQKRANSFFSMHSGQEQMKSFLRRFWHARCNCLGHVPNPKWAGKPSIGNRREIQSRVHGRVNLRSAS
jgi:hypothetical protein